MEKKGKKDPLRLFTFFFILQKIHTKLLQGQILFENKLQGSPGTQEELIFLNILCLNLNII